MRVFPMNLLMLSGDRTLAAGEHGPFHDMLEELRRHWRRIDVICPRVARAVELRPFDNVFLHPAAGGRWRYPAHIRETARRLARQAPTALVVSHDYGLFLNAAGARRLQRDLRIPWISEIHHVDGYPARGSLTGALRRSLTRLHVRRALPRAAAFRTVSNQVAWLLESWGVPRARIRLLGSLYLDLDRFSPAAVEQDVDLLFCGRLEPEKGPWLLLDCLELLKRQRPGLRATVLGRGSLAARFARRLRARDLADTVELRSWVDGPGAVADLYRRSRVLICTSYWEGNPRVVAEAMACGVAVVSTRVGRAPELIDDGRNGRLAGWDAGELAAAAGELLADDARRGSIAARAPAAVQGFERAAVIAQLATAYREIAEAAA